MTLFLITYPSRRRWDPLPATTPTTTLPPTTPKNQNALLWRRRLGPLPAGILLRTDPLPASAACGAGWDPCRLGSPQDPSLPASAGCHCAAGGGTPCRRQHLSPLSLSSPRRRWDPLPAATPATTLPATTPPAVGPPAGHAPNQNALSWRRRLGPLPAGTHPQDPPPASRTPPLPASAGCGAGWDSCRLRSPSGPTPCQPVPAATAPPAVGPPAGDNPCHHPPCHHLAGGGTPCRRQPLPPPSLSPPRRRWDPLPATPSYQNALSWRRRLGPLVLHACCIC